MSFKEKINVYTCPNWHQTVTIDRDEGVTPFIIQCRHEDETDRRTCGKEATSSFYKVPQDGTFEPTHEWFRPTDLSKLSPSMRQHVEMGGLELRKIPNIAVAGQPVTTAPTRKYQWMDDFDMPGSDPDDSVDMFDMFGVTEERALELRHNLREALKVDNSTQSAVLFIDKEAGTQNEFGLMCMLLGTVVERM